MIHDFTSTKRRWGWNVLNQYPKGDGYTGLFIGRGVKEGDTILLGESESPTAYVATMVKYSSNPTDLFDCDYSPVIPTAP